MQQIEAIKLLQKNWTYQNKFSKNKKWEKSISTNLINIILQATPHASLKKHKLDFEQTIIPPEIPPIH